METKLGKSRDKTIKKEKVLKVYWQLYLKPDHKREQVQGDLKMPTNLSTSYKGEGICVPVLLECFDDHEVKSGDVKSDKEKARHEKSYADKLHDLTVMRDSSSSNILHARLVLEGKSPILHCVETYDGNLADYLVSRSLGIPEFSDPMEKLVLPTSNMSSAISQVVDGMNQLIISGKYHGNFTLENTLYIINPKGDLVLKLSGFRRKTGSRKQIIAADWYSLADGLTKIYKLAKDLNKMAINLPKISTCQLKGLITFLRTSIGGFNAEIAFELIKKQPFFWGKAERKVFFIYTIPLALKKDKFVSDVKSAALIKLPWASDGFDGFLDKMNKYRVKRGLDEYDTKCPESFVHFISGLYTHEKQIKAVLKVDVALQKRHPKLCYKLYTLLPGTLRT